MEQVALPKDIFRKTAKTEYSSFRRALIREFYQNSVDARAKNIKFNLTDHGNFKVFSAEDDGKGMTLEECRTRLLTIGGSGKDEYSVGGFGKAKEILYFSWPTWSIRSHDYRIDGEGCYFKVETDLPYQAGVTSIINIDAEEFTEQDIRDYLSLCDAKATTFVQGTEFTSSTDKGRRFKDLGYGVLYKKVTEGDYKLRTNKILVRVNGVHMFDRYISETLPCRLTLELTGNARTILTSNRDGLRQEYSAQLDAVIQDIVVNTMSALKEKPEFSYKKFYGTGHVETRRKFQEPEVREEVRQEINKAKEKFSIEALTALAQFANLLGTKVPTKTINIEETLSRVDNRPDILVKAPGGKIPRKFNPKFWQYKVQASLALWLLIIKQVMLDNNVETTFGIGITLDETVEASFETIHGIPYFLINPGIWHYKPSLNAAGKFLLVQEIKQRAIHELGHFVTGANHNEQFIAVIHKIEANTWKNEAAYRKLVKLKKINFQV